MLDNNKTGNNSVFSYTQQVLDNYSYPAVLLRIIKDQNHPLDFEILSVNLKYEALKPCIRVLKEGFKLSDFNEDATGHLLILKDFLFDITKFELPDNQVDGHFFSYEKFIIDHETIQLNIRLVKNYFPFEQTLSLKSQILYAVDYQEGILNNWQFFGDWEKLSGYNTENIICFPNGWFSLLNSKVKESLLEHLNVNIIKKEDIQIKCKNGNSLWIEHEYRVAIDNGILRIYGIITDINDKKQNDLYLNNLQTAFEQTSSSVVITDKYGSIQYVNRKFSETTGYSSKEVLGKNPKILKTGHTSKQQYRMLWDIILSGKTWRGQFINKKKNGEKYWEKAVIAPVFNEKGDITNFVAVKEDITQLKAIENDREKVEKALKANEEKFRVLFNLASDPIFISDFEGNLLQTNDLTCQLFKIDCKSIEGLKLQNLFGPEEVNQLIGNLRVASTKKVLQELSLYRDANEIIFEFNSSVIEVGGQKFILTIARDITDRKLAEKAIQESEMKFRLLIENVSAVFWMLDLKTLKLLYISPNFNKIYGYSIDDFIEGQIENYLSMVHPEDVKFVTRNLRKGLVEDIDQLEFRIFTKSGKVQWMQYKSYVIALSDGTPVQVGFCEDVTERMRISHQLSEQNKELNKINKELDQFVYRVSHNLRAPLTSILGIVNLLKVIQSEADKADYIKLIETSILKLDETIHEIIDYSKNSRIDIQSEPVDVEAVVHETLDSLKFMNEKNEVKVTLANQVNQAIFTDGNRLKVILNNLISNAFKYADESKEKSTITIMLTLDNCTLNITIKDNGIGIREQDRDKIFNMFYRGTDKSFGAGLGLAIVKEVVDKMNGTINLHSKVYEFTEFNITLPVSLN